MSPDDRRGLLALRDAWDKELATLLDRCEGRAGIEFTAQLRGAIRRVLAIQIEREREMALETLAEQARRDDE